MRGVSDSEALRQCVDEADGMVKDLRDLVRDETFAILRSVEHLRRHIATHDELDQIMRIVEAVDRLQRVIVRPTAPPQPLAPAGQT